MRLEIIPSVKAALEELARVSNAKGIEQEGRVIYLSEAEMATLEGEAEDCELSFYSSSIPCRYMGFLLVIDNDKAINA